MQIIFCSDPLSPGKPDETYNDEVSAATEAGFEYLLVNYERLVHEEDAAAAVRRVRMCETPETALYRGWMLRPSQYNELYEALAERGVTLINTPQAYQHCHYLPESYPLIAGHTPETIWLPLERAQDMTAVMQALAPFGDKPLILKDYVKSRKHEWHEACFIPSASDGEAVRRVVQRFVDLQGENINQGLVFREYVPLQSVGVHSKSGMPLTKEFRLFFFEQKLLFCSEYWDEGTYSGEPPPLEMFQPIAATIQSRFFTMDVAQSVDGRWLIIELGDGQVAGLPKASDAARLYQALDKN